MTGIQTDPASSTWEQYVNSAQMTNSTIYPAYLNTGLVTGVGNVIAAYIGNENAVNGVAKIRGHYHRLIGFSGGCASIAVLGLSNQVSADVTDLYGPIFLTSRIDEVTSLGKITIHRETGDILGYLGFFEIGLVNVPSPVAGGQSIPAFSLQVKFGQSGNVNRVIDSGGFTHTGPNSIVNQIPYLLSPEPNSN